MAGCALCGNRQGRCRYLAINAGDTAENPATLQAKWGSMPYPTDYPPGSPTQENSPTRYEQQFEAGFALEPRRRGNRNRTGSWKVREAGSWNDILKRPRPTSSRRRKKKLDAKFKRKQTGSLPFHDGVKIALFFTLNSAA